jgi:hypothetical protein
MTTYRERLKAGIHDANQQQPEPELTADNLPGRHGALDNLARERGIVWNSDQLTVAEKQQQLREHLES